MTTYLSTDVPKSVPVASVVLSTITVPDAVTIETLRVSVTVATSCITNLGLYHPDGTLVALEIRASDLTCGILQAGENLYDAATPTCVNYANPPWNGLILSDLLGKPSAGEWRLVLYISQFAGCSSNDLTAWSLEINGADVPDNPPDEPVAPPLHCCQTDLLARLLPPSSYDPTGPLLAAWLAAESAALCAALGRAGDLAEEIDLRTAYDLFTDWERVAGLPDPCVGGARTNEQRRATLLERITGTGGQTPAYFIALAAQLGYAIGITELRPHDVNSDVDASLCGPECSNVWQVDAALGTFWEFSVEDNVDDPLAVWGERVLECLINRLKPAHTLAIFSYS